MLPAHPARIPVAPSAPPPASAVARSTEQGAAVSHAALPSESQKTPRNTLRQLACPPLPASPHPAWNAAYNEARTGGHPLPEADRTYFEQRYGYSMENVRIHADGRSSEAARSVGARAFTLGHHIVFDAQQYSPSTAGGRRLLAHELAHVVQQSRGGASFGAPPGSASEHFARSAASAAVLSGAGVVPISGASSPGIARDALSLIQNLDPSRLSDFELQQETLQVNAWLSQHANVSDPNTEQMTNALRRLEAEERKRQANRQPPQPRRPLLPNIKGGGAQDLEGAMAVIDAIHPSENASGLYTLEFQGEEKTLTQEQVDLLKRRARSVLIDHIGRVEAKNAGTRAGYASQKATDRDHWLVAPIVKFLGNVQDPGPYLDSAISDADSFDKQARAALDAGHFAQAAEMMARGETRALSAQRMWQAYFQGIISAGEMTITVLEVTRDAAFITLGILATVATGGAAAGAGATAFGVDLGVGVGTAANVIAVGAPIVASLSEAAAKVAMGDPVDWGELTLNIAVSILLARFGGKATEGIAEAVLARVAKGVEQRVAKLIIKRAVQAAILHAGSTALTTTVNAVYQRLSGKKITWGDFMNQLVKALTDPKGIAVTVVTTAIATKGELQFASEPAPTVTTSERAAARARRAKAGCVHGPKTIRRASGTYTGRATSSPCQEGRCPSIRAEADGRSTRRQTADRNAGASGTHRNCRRQRDRPGAGRQARAQGASGAAHRQAAGPRKEGQNPGTQRTGSCRSFPPR